jgi:hypothetical protein
MKNTYFVRNTDELNMVDSESGEVIDLYRTDYSIRNEMYLAPEKGILTYRIDNDTLYSQKVNKEDIIIVYGDNFPIIFNDTNVKKILLEKIKKEKVDRMIESSLVNSELDGNTTI